MTKSTLETFAAGARDGAYPGGQLAASVGMRRLVTVSVGRLFPGANAKVTNETQYDLASLTKPLATGVLVGRALETGLMRLEDPIARYVPGAHPRVCIEHLLEHASGYPAHHRFDLELPPDCPAGSWEAWRFIVARAAATPLLGPPGERALYSDIGFILLGAALEVAFAMPLSSAFLLLGTSLSYRDRRGPPALPPLPSRTPVAPTEDAAPGFVHDENTRAMGGAAGHAGLFGTAQGVLELAEQLVLAYHGYRGGLLLPETVRRLWQPSRVPNSTRTLAWDRPSEIESSTGGRWPKHSVGHLGFTGTSLWIDPEPGLIVVLVTNRVCPTRANNLIRGVRRELHDAAYREWGEPANLGARSAAKRPATRRT